MDQGVSRNIQDYSNLNPKQSTHQSELTSQNSQDQLVEMQEAEYQNERDQQITRAQRICIEDANVDLDRNRKAQFRAVLRGLYGLKSDIFYDPQGLDDIVNNQPVLVKKEEDGDGEEEDEKVDLIDHYTNNFVELNRLLKTRSSNFDELLEPDDPKQNDKFDFDPVKRLAKLKRDIQRDVFKKFGFHKLDLGFAELLKKNEQELFVEEREESSPGSDYSSARNSQDETKTEALGSQRSVPE